MSAPALAGHEPPAVRIRGTAYPVLLPGIRDPRLHLAAVTISLHILGQVAFGFRLSIAQILIAVGTAAVLELGITLHRSRVIMWPASALLTGNGIAFILRVPGTEHGDWWSTKGWWLFAGTSAVAIGSKYLIRFRGRHVLNPSNGALVLTFLLFGPELADPLEFWWAPMSVWMALALAIIVAGGFAILWRLKLLSIAVTFWLAFAAAIGVIAIAGHEMTARWHLGPLTGVDLWRAIVLSPEILVFLFFMITDPKTIPRSAAGRRAYALGVACLAALLIAPTTTEFWSKVAVLGALVIVCVARVPLELLSGRVTLGRQAPTARAGLVTLGVAGVAGLLVVAGIPARPGPTAAPLDTAATELPRVTIGPSSDVMPALERMTAERIAAALVADLRIGAETVRAQDTTRASQVASGEWLAGLLRGITASEVTVPIYDIDELRLRLELSDGQAPPPIVAEASGTFTLLPLRGAATASESAVAFRQTFELAEQDGHYVIVRSRSASPDLLASAVIVRPPPAGGVAALSAVRLEDVAPQVGLDFRQGAFRFGASGDTPAMMGGGLCWLDADGDGWIDLFVTNSYTDAELYRWNARGGPPRSALFHNDRGRFVDVSRAAGADLAIRANGCVAADFDLDGRTDLYVTAMGADALLWNRGGGRFEEVAQSAGITTWGWHAGAAVGDVNGDGLPDLFVAGYTDPLNPIPGSSEGFPTDHVAVADRLYVNLGGGGRPRFREVAKTAGIEAAGVEHGLGAVLTDANGDGRLDLFVANDEDPNRLYLNVAEPNDPEGLGFRLVESAQANGVADPNAGMGIAATDFTGDGIGDLLVTNSRDQLHAVHRGNGSGAPLFTDARSRFAGAFDATRPGWGVSWIDLDNDGRLELALANGAIPVTQPTRDAQPLAILANAAPAGTAPRFADVTAGVGLADGPMRIGRGLAAADFDNDGDLDLALGSIGGRLVLLRSSGARGHWLKVAFEQFSPGAVVTATLPDGRRLVREVHAGSSYLSSEDPRIHFGLGGAATVRELTVRYPDGIVVRFTNLPANRLVTVSGP